MTSPSDPAVRVDPAAASPLAPETIWYKGKRVIRTVLAALLVIVPTANLALPALADAFNAPDVPGSVYLLVNSAIAAVLVVLGIVTRIMAIPVVNAWLIRVGAGSVPAEAITTR